MGYNTPKQTVSQFQLKGRYARQYLSFAGKSSKDFLLYLSGPGVYDSPAADVESTSVPGRNGDIITENARTGRRRYQNVDIKYKAFFFNGLPAKTAAVKAWLLSPIGYQKLQDTYDPDFFRMAVCKDALAFDVTAQKAAEMELAKPSDTMQSQPFRIYKITTPIDGKLEVQARHISYQLNFITVSSFSVTGCVGAMQGLKSHAASDCPFNVWTDVESSATFTLGVPSSFRNCLGGMAGSVLDVFGGEFEWDRYTVRFHKARGADHNVHIIYGKNLTDFKMEKSIENTITGVHPYWVDNETQAVMELPEKVVLQSKRSIPYQKITVLDCTSNFQEKPSEAALREYAQNYIDTTDLTEPEIDIKIDFLQLWNTPGYGV